MRDRDLAQVCIGNLHLLDSKKAAFVRSVSLVLRKSHGLSPAQHQYLQAIYDVIISKKYQLEEMSTDRETAAKRAISKARKTLGK